MRHQAAQGHRGEQKEESMGKTCTLTNGEIRPGLNQIAGKLESVDMDVLFCTALTLSARKEEKVT